MPPRWLLQQLPARSGAQRGQPPFVRLSELELFVAQVLVFVPRRLSTLELGGPEIELQVLEFEEVGIALEVKVQGGRLVMPQQSGRQTERDIRSSQRRLNWVS